MDSLELAKRFQKLVQKPTVTDSGSKYFEDFQETFKEVFPLINENLELIKLEGNAIIYKWKGKKSDRPVILMAHQDVVPATETDWKFPPFSGEISDGKVWGRGSMDCKSTLFCVSEGVESLLREGYKTPNQDIYLAFSDCEETGGPGAERERDWFINNNIKPAMAIDEGGAIVNGEFPGMVKPTAVVGILEKGYCDIKFIARSEGGHSSTPPRNTPFERLAKLITYFTKHKHQIFKYEMTDAAVAMLEGVSNSIEGPLKFVTKHARALKPLIVGLLPKLTPFGDALFATTMVFTQAQGSGAPNVIPQEAYVIANLRFSQQENVEATIEKIRKIAKKFDCEIETYNTREASPVVNLEGEDYKYFEKVLKDVYPEICVSPYVMFGGTDCRTMQQIAPCALRHTPTYLSGQQLHAMHSSNENIDIQALIDGSRFYNKFIKDFK